MAKSNKPAIHIVCICAGIGFPIGQANTNRVCHIGRTIIDGGGRFTVWHFGTSPTELNKEKKGVWNGIEFEYLCTQIQRPKNKFVRQAVHFTGIVKLFFRIFFQLLGRKNTYVYLDLQKTTLNIVIAPLCRLLGIKTVQEVNEWWPEVADTSKLIKFLYKKVMFRFSHGSFLISNSIQKKILQTTDYHPRHKFYYLPILSEPVAIEAKGQDKNGAQPSVFWCGMVDGYINDVLFMIEAFGRVNKSFPMARLVISGKCSEGARERLQQAVKEQGIPLGQFVLTGFISNQELERYVKEAAVAVAPMWNDEKSNTRFPTKLGIFSFAGKAIVTAPVGELKEYFIDDYNCLFYEPGNTNSLAAKITELLTDKEKASFLGKNAKALAEKTFSYKNYIESMQAFFSTL